MENKIQKKETNQLITQFEIESKLNSLVDGQTNNSKQLKAIHNDLHKGFIGLVLSNQELLKVNKELNLKQLWHLNLLILDLNNWIIIRYSNYFLD